MLRKLILITILSMTLGLGLTYAQTSALDIAQNQASGSNNFANERLTASNANRYAELQNQVGTTIRSHTRIVDEGNRNLDQTLRHLNAAATSYSSFNLRFLH